MLAGLTSVAKLRSKKKSLRKLSEGGCVAAIRGNLWQKQKTNKLKRKNICFFRFYKNEQSGKVIERTIIGHDFWYIGIWLLLNNLLFNNSRNEVHSSSLYLIYSVWQKHTAWSQIWISRVDTRNLKARKWKYFHKCYTYLF